MTLDDRDRAVLDRLAEGDADAETLAGRVDDDPGAVRERLAALADDGLVRPVDGGYRLTENGERVVAASPARPGDRMDTSPEVEAAVESLDLRADRAAAVRGAYAFLRYWERATAGELADGVYSEVPAGFDSPARWWEDCVRDNLAALPTVERGDDAWRYTGTPTVAAEDGDGRQVSGDALADSSVRAALERADLDGAERSAVRAAFDALFRQGEATDRDLRAAGDRWDDRVRETLAGLPGVDPPDGDGVWTYPSSAGSRPADS